MGKKQPEAPDPKETATAQAAANRSTAITQQNLNMVNQNNPWGSVSYDQTGSRKHFDEMSGKWVETPTFTQTTTLTPEQQAIFNQTQKAQGNLAGIAEDQSAKIRDLLNTPFEFNNQDAANWAYDLGSQRLDPRFAQDEEKLRTTLKNKGIQEGSEAWNTEMSRMTQAKNDAYNQLMLTGRGQAFSEALAQRNQPLNEIIGLMSGSQIQNPAQMSGATPQTGVANTDYTGLVNQKYQSELNSYQSKMGGLFGLGSAAMGILPFSDRRLKRDIERIGTLANGLPWYRFNYKWDDKDAAPREGLMSDDVRHVIPDAVVIDPASGFDTVNYSVAMGAIQ
ncbi:tail fiber domain-containing protein [Brucella sp. 6810]|uniref:tail fiber domain-containing protein n=1 Tax=Brucella sp. 6810 TaxID=2769351 RepID=UPI00165CCEAA|nr:tail fiber domain-containing protein [Brucella sp. 6810]QNQ62518.1 tail fiber domain-containing protein [Brucella sp. 6810]